MFSSIDPSDDLRSLSAAVAAAIARLEAGEVAGHGPRRSLAELRADEDDFLWLKRWAWAMDERVVNACRNRFWQKLRHGNAHLSFEGKPVDRGSGIGLLLLLFASECARREATEGKLWPHVRMDQDGRPRFGVGALSLLFDENGPSSLYKERIRQAVDTFRLRDALNRPDVQPFYRTVFLQFGFPIRDARKRLAQWLPTGAAQVVCQDLLDPSGPHFCEGFCQLWESLRAFRRGNLGAESMLQLLRRSPWVLPEWSSELVDLARRECVGYGESAGDRCEEDRRFLSPPALKWQRPRSPTLAVRLQNLAELGLSGSEYEVRLGGQLRARIFRVDDRYDAEPSDELEVPLTSATLLAELIDEDGRVALAEMVDCWDSTSPATLFRLPEGSRVGPKELVRTTGEYALLAASDLELHPRSESPVAIGTPLALHRLWRIPAQELSPASLRDAGGSEVWTPPDRVRLSKDQPDWARRMSASLDGMTAEHDLLTQPVSIRIRHGSDVTVLYARTGPRVLDVLSKPGDQTLAGPFVVSPESLVYPDAEGARRTLDLIVGVLHRGERARVVLPVEVRGVAAAVLRGEGWVPLDRQAGLDRSASWGDLFRIVPPPEWRGESIAFGDWAVMEGNTWIGRPGRSGCRLPGLIGLGAPLTVRRGPYNSMGDVMGLAREVVDRGVIREVAFDDAEDGARRLRVGLSRGIEVDSDCRIILWCRDGRLLSLPPEGEPAGEGEIAARWTALLPVSEGSPRAVALSFQGVRQGLWWSADWAQNLEVLGCKDATGLAAAIRWLRMPLLSRGAFKPCQDFARAFAPEVLRAWVLSEVAPEGLIWRADDGFLAAVRALLRDWEPGDAMFPELVDALDGDPALGEEPVPHVGLALRLAELSPLLMASMLRSWADSARMAGDAASVRATLKFVEERLMRRIDPSRQVIGPGTALERARERIAGLLGGVDPHFVESLTEAAVAHVRTGKPLTTATGDNIDVAIGMVPAFRDLLAIECLSPLISLVRGVPAGGHGSRLAGSPS